MSSYSYKIFCRTSLPKNQRIDLFLGTTLLFSVPSGKQPVMKLYIRLRPQQNAIHTKIQPQHNQHDGGKTSIHI